ncbi:hypothetical protein GLYMA_12G000451v4 [Glycine max]|nr:hypothetical protein GLYMA_12G000451v4 [Glycine max]KAH1140864.1 hypothetical protein GYH30_032239 [Glycine max]
MFFSLFSFFFLILSLEPVSSTFSLRSHRTFQVLPILPLHLFA